MRRIFILIFTILLSCSFCFAETVVLKSGKIREGRIIERSDRYIKMELGGVPLTYYLDEIESIDGQSLALSTSRQEFAPVESGNTSAWDYWSATITPYLENFEAIQVRSRQLAIESNNELNEAMKKDDRVLGREIIIEAGNRLTTIIDELTALNPPQELKAFHEKTIEGYRYRKMSNDAILTNNVNDSTNYGRKAAASEMESIVEIKRVYSEHNAPEELIESLNLLIEDYTKLMNGS